MLRTNGSSMSVKVTMQYYSADLSITTPPYVLSSHHSVIIPALLSIVSYELCGTAPRQLFIPILDLTPPFHGQGKKIYDLAAFHLPPRK
jgi:hypothetical protein